MVDQGFLTSPCRDMMLVDTDLPRLLDRMKAYQPPSYTWTAERPM
jgi:hypothetical protein